MEIRLKREPHAQQLKFINCQAREQLYGGAKRGGKSVALAIKAILLSILFPGNRILLARNDFTDLQDTTLQEFWQTVPNELLDYSYGTAGHHKGERTIRLKTVRDGITSDIIYRGLGNEVDVEKAKGLNLGALLIDEPSEVNYETFKMLNAQLTWKLADGTAPIYMTCLACNPEPGWVKERYIEHPVPGSVFIPSLPRENPFLPDGWENELRGSYDEDWIKKYLDGSWDVAEGSVFPELMGEVHNCEVTPEEVRGMDLYAAIDHGGPGVSCMEISGVDFNNNEFGVGEYYDEEKVISHHCRKMLDLMEEFGGYSRFKMVLIDPSTTQRTLQKGDKLQAIVDEYREYMPKDMCIIPAWNKIEAGINSIKERLKIDPLHAHPLRHGKDGKPLMGSPRLFINRRRCPNLWKHMKEYRRKYTPSGETKLLGIEHAIDPKRYITVAIRPPKRTAHDEAAMSSMDRHLNRSHDQWRNKWDKGALTGDGKGNLVDRRPRTWFT